MVELVIVFIAGYQIGCWIVEIPLAIYKFVNRDRGTCTTDIQG